VNLDDIVGVRIARANSDRRLSTTGYSLSPEGIVAGSVDSYIAAREINVRVEETRVVLGTSWGEREVTLRQLGRFNVSNILGVIGCLLASGLDIDAAVKSVQDLPDVMGRMQRVGGAGRPLAVIDYAHTPDALEKVLNALRPVADAGKGRLIVVFGAGGDRDALKRPRMGEIAERLSDRIVLTSDNPRSEDPMTIIQAIRAGIGTAHEVEPDRRKAIAGAISRAHPGDVVLIAGKGHENYQESAGKRLPFSDVAIAKEAIGAWRAT
jgi:UDP-N-acetylmuramoyl-L-alanyl-D-glutamate--2,6-diaminopimelate ligase